MATLINVKYYTHFSCFKDIIDMMNNSYHSSKAFVIADYFKEPTYFNWEEILNKKYLWKEF
jgi:hypothetical protein